MMFHVEQPGIEIRRATEADAERLAKTLRAADRAELFAATGKPSGLVVKEAVAASDEPIVGLIDGELACIFGIELEDALLRRGCVWMLTSDVVERHPLRFLRAVRAVMPQVTADYDYLFNHVYVKNTTAIHWLKWLGFEMHDPHPSGPFNDHFHFFDMRSCHV